MKMAFTAIFGLIMFQLIAWMSYICAIFPLMGGHSTSSLTYCLMYQPFKEIT